MNRAGQDIREGREAPFGLCPSYETGKLHTTRAEKDSQGTPT